VAPTAAARPAATTNFAWSAIGGKVITVAPGETLDILTAKYGVPQNQILTANQLTSPAQVSAGRVLVMPHLVAITPDQSGQATVALANPPAPQSVSAPAARPLTSGGTHTVVTGDTLFNISQRAGTTVEALMTLNNLGGQSQVRIGQVLRLPGTAASAPAPVVAVAAPKPAPAPIQLASNAPLPKIPQPPAVEAAVKAVAAGGAQIPAAQASLTPPRAAIDASEGPSANGTTFRWPVRGRIIAGFGTGTAGQRNDGINLAVPEGTSVKAAEAGTVIYAGNELEGYGNLILVRHADGWVSAYAHNKDLMVKRGDSVTRGQIIGHAGMTGSVSAPQVHFELRQGSKPVNPLDHLSG
jgi:murein DD-endopeptidase MepM/ murein hydrolase activator NlpD